MKGIFRLLAALGFLFAVGPLPCGLHAQSLFRRGDVDDSGEVNLADPIRLLNVLFSSRPIQGPCRDAADADDNGQVELTDAVYLLSYLFRQGAPPLGPFPSCGEDPTRDRLSCQAMRCLSETLDPLFEPSGGREAFVFMIDRSGSMSGQGALGLAKRELMASLGQLPPDARFSVIFYNLQPTQIAGAPRPGGLEAATQASKEAVRARLGAIDAEGGTDHARALREAFAAGPEVVFLLTDGSPTRGDGKPDSTDKILVGVRAWNALKRITIHCIAIGRDLNEQFLRQLAAENGGEFKQF